MIERLLLTRIAYLPTGTYGKLELPDGSVYYTVELPWNANKDSISCIPDGVYRLGMRESPVVKSSSGGEFHEGWEVLDVPGREYIMIHPGNWPMNFKGCIGVGKALTFMQDKRGDMVNAVTESRTTFSKLMAKLDKAYEWELEIRPFIMQYP